jgi:hypothetical protein
MFTSRCCCRRRQEAGTDSSYTFVLLSLPEFTQLQLYFTAAPAAAYFTFQTIFTMRQKVF